MSETDPVFPHHATPLKQYKTKKRRRDEAHDGEDGLVDEAKAKKKKRKHGEESGDNQAPPITTNLDTEATPVVTEKKRKKEKRKRTSDVTGEQPDQPDTATVEANAGTEKKKKKRKRDTDVDATAETRVEAGGEGKKKRKHHAMDAQDGVQVETAGTSTIALPIDPPAKKKKKSKEKAPSSSTESAPGASIVTATTASHPPDNGGLFPLPNYGMPFPPYYPGAQPNGSLFPTNPFPDLAFGSNEDVLRALQDLDLSKIAGVLKTLSDAADSANVPLTGPIPSSSTRPAGSSSLSGGSQTIPKHKKHRRTLDMTLPSSSSEPQTDADHAHLLATKWMGPTKLAELVKTEGLVYKKGKFSAIEIKQVNEAMEKYRTARGLTEEDINSIIFPRDEKQKDAAFWSEITSALSQRPIIAVYHYVRRAHHPMKQQGKWTPEEDARLVQAVTSLGQQWEKVAALVGRMATDCRDRYRNHIVDREKRVAGVWSSAEEDELTRIVTEMQKGKDLDNDVFWSKVTDLMGGSRSRQQCRIKWTDSLSKKYKNEGQNPRWSGRDAYILIQKIDALNVRDDTEINWRSLLDSQWNLWSAHILQRRWLTMKKGIKGFEDMTHPEIMDILRVKNAEAPHVKAVKSAKFIVDSDDEEPHPGSSTGPGTLAGQGNVDDEDSE